MKYLNKPVAYLEDQDFTPDGKLVTKDIPKDMPVVVMVQSLWCPHCTDSKPAFQSFANKTNGKVFCTTIQADGTRQSEKKLAEKIQTLFPTFRGFPHYAVYKNGELVPKEIKGRTEKHLVEFCEV